MFGQVAFLQLLLALIANGCTPAPELPKTTTMQATTTTTTTTSTATTSTATTSTASTSTTTTSTATTSTEKQNEIVKSTVSTRSGITVNVEMHETYRKIVRCVFSLRCREDKNESQPWSECIHSFSEPGAAECYNSGKRRMTTYCKSNSFMQCTTMEIQRCLHKQTCTGEWSAWSEYTFNCSSSCGNGTNTRTRYCQKDGVLANGLCFGEGEFDISNQTQSTNCSSIDCKEGETQLDPTNKLKMWRYALYGGAGFIGLILVMLTVTGGRAIYKWRNRLQTPQQERASESSNSFVIVETTQHKNVKLPVPSTTDPQPTPYACFKMPIPEQNQLESPITTPFNNSSIQTTCNTYQNIEQSGVVAPSQNSTGSLHTTFKELPSFLKGESMSGMETNPTKGESKCFSVLDKIRDRNSTFVEGCSVDDEATLATYTKMNSFSTYTPMNAHKVTIGVYSRKYKRSSGKNKLKHQSFSAFVPSTSSSSHESTASLKRYPASGTTERTIKKRSLRKNQGRSSFKKKVSSISQQLNRNVSHSNKTNIQSSSCNTVADRFAGNGQRAQNTYSNVAFQNQRFATDDNGYLAPIQLSGTLRSKLQKAPVTHSNSHYEEVVFNDSDEPASMENRDVSACTSMEDCKKTIKSRWKEGMLCSHSLDR